MQMKRGDGAKGMRTYFASGTSATDAVLGLINGVLSLPSLLAGLILGLVIGLLIGWVLWPVEWSSARPTHLDPDARAQYLAAVADSYAASQDTVALQIAKRRLIEVNAATEIPNAIAYFARGTKSEGAYQPPFTGSDAYQQFNADDGNIRINNLKQLAGALGIPISNQVIPAPDVAPAAGIEQPGDSANIVDDSSPDAQEAEDSNSTNLVGVGDAPGVSAPSSLFDNFSTILGCLGGLVLLFGGLAVLYIYMQRRQSQSTSASVAPSTIVEDVSTTVDKKDLVEGYANYRFAEEPVVDNENMSTDTFAESDGAEWRATETDFEFEPDPFFDAEDEFAAQESFTTNTPITDSVNGLLIDEFIARYQIGNLDYEEIRPIFASDSTNSIGEFGMGVNTKNGIYLNNPEHVIAVDVWLFDKTDAENLSNETLVFLSEYAAANGDLRESIADEEADGLAPIVPELGARFKLEGKNLFLLCEVIDVAFSPAEPEGIFEELEVKLAVFAKKGTP